MIQKISNLLIRSSLRLWPFQRGRDRLTKIAERLIVLPGAATFGFRYGRFVDAPLREWPRGYRELYLWGTMENCELSQWKRVLRQGDLVIDCGTNLGYWSLVASRLVGGTGQVIAFEPVPSTFERAQKNILASRRTNIVLKNAAVGAKLGKIQLFLAKDDEAGARASCSPGQIETLDSSITAPMMRIDDLKEIENRRVSMLKLDIEGGELNALQGAKTVIDRDHPVIAFEWNRVTAHAAGYSPDQIRYLLEEEGYTFWTCTHSGLIPFRERTDLSQWSPMVWALPKTTS